MKNWLCKIAGHKRWFGYSGMPGYGEVSGGHTDGIGRSHWRVVEQCERCGEKFTAARFHGREGWK